MDEDRIVDIFIIGIIITILVLKLTNVITISWIWLLSPIWILFGIGFVLAIILTLICLLQEYIHKKEKK
jgi:hypothetical protein